MKPMLVTALAMVLAIASRSIAAADVKSPDFVTADMGAKALVLFSTSADETRLAAGTMLRMNRVEIKKNGHKRLKQMDGFFVDNPMVQSHIPGEHVNVHWRALEPGNYLLERVLVNPMACFDQYITFWFTVAAGDYVYLGNFHDQRGVIVVRDGYERDFAFFRAHTGGEKPESFTALPAEQKEKSNFGCEHHL